MSDHLDVLRQLRQGDEQALPLEGNMMSTIETVSTEQVEQSTQPKLYTPNMVFFSSMLGGLLGGLVLLWKNYTVLNQSEKANKTIVIGLPSFLLFCLVFSFLPASTLHTVMYPLQLGAAMTLRSFAEVDQWKLRDPNASRKGGPKASWWVTILLTVITIPLVLGIGIVAAGLHLLLMKLFVFPFLKGHV